MSLRNRIESDHYEATHGERYSEDRPSRWECDEDERQTDPGPDVPFVPLTREELGMDPIFDILSAARADENEARDTYGDRAVVGASRDASLRDREMGMSTEPRREVRVSDNDPEILAMKAIGAALGSLEPTAAIRIIAWADARYGEAAAIDAGETTT